MKNICHIKQIPTWPRLGLIHTALCFQERIMSVRRVWLCQHYVILKEYVYNATSDNIHHAVQCWIVSTNAILYIMMKEISYMDEHYKLSNSLRKIPQRDNLIVSASVDLFHMISCKVPTLRRHWTLFCQFYKHTNNKHLKVINFYKNFKRIWNEINWD